MLANLTASNIPAELSEGKWTPMSILDSSIILERAVLEIEKLGYGCSNVDITIIAQKPRLSPYIPNMKKVLGQILKIDATCVGIKATTNEGIGSLGRAEGIAAYAVSLLSRKLE